MRLMVQLTHRTFTKSARSVSDSIKKTKNGLSVVHAIVSNQAPALKGNLAHSVSIMAHSLL